MSYGLKFRAMFVSRFLIVGGSTDYSIFSLTMDCCKEVLQSQNVYFSFNMNRGNLELLSTHSDEAEAENCIDSKSGA